MSSYQQHLNQAQVAAVDESRCLLEQTVLDCPMFNNAMPRSIVNWVVMLFQLLLAFLDAVLQEISAHISNVEADIPTSGGVPSNVATVAQGGPTPSTAVWPTKSPQCTKCHACGHSTEMCLTKDPTVMRKRVAGNQKKKKDACKPPPLPILHPLYPFIATTTSSPTPQDVAMAADAEELWRRHCQSACDRKKHRAATATPAS
ncbi:hypothetical protein EDD16DRAFT_1524835 [Pisolithus croceorrhizus]|nr:hypothetical protein EV401DRAFT_2080780 [Pisolithus croceorrhizus]KAI6104035.1 hypothetical protein EDD16DRAFT_1524835 [Pisolithus croceorrhizus]KAI6166164.1 hypothetical protein EDD17DRAFT_1753640 [Pisolithus thermaeus]